MKSQIKQKIETALKYAHNEGVLICEVNELMKSISASTAGGNFRIKSIIRDNPEIVIGFYKVTEHFDEATVKGYITEDTKHLQ